MSIAPSPYLLSSPSIEEHLNLFPCTQVGIQGIRFIEQAQPIKPFKKRAIILMVHFGCQISMCGGKEKTNTREKRRPIVFYFSWKMCLILEQSVGQTSHKSPLPFVHRRAPQPETQRRQQRTIFFSMVQCVHRTAAAAAARRRLQRATTEPKQGCVRSHSSIRWQFHKEP